jgi:microcystin-dependent protein
VPLDRASIKPGQRLRTRWITDLYDLLNGTLTDTDVTLGRNLTVRGALSTVGSVSQVAPGPANVPMTLYGAPSQTANLFEIRDSGSNLLFSVSAAGTITPFRVTDFSAAQHNHGSVAQGGPLVQVLPPGVIMPFGGTVAPTGYLLCDGSLVSRVTFASLFATIGTAYGAGDGATTFAVPDLRSRVPVGSGTGGAGLTNRTNGQVGGEETHVMTVAEMPAHAHTLTDPTHNHTITDPGHVHLYGPGSLILQGNTNGSSNENFLSSGGAGSQTNSATTGLTHAAGSTGITMANTGGTAPPHNNLQPFVATAYIIKT